MKRRQRHSDFDLVIVDGRNVVVFDTKVGGGQFPALLRYGVGKTGIFAEGKTEQALLCALRARLVLLTDGAELGPLSLDPPDLADFFISLIPIKHRANLAGDLEEEYWTRLIPRHGLRKARFLYWIQAIYALLGFLVRPLAGVAGIRWIRKAIEILIHKLMR